MEIRKVGDWLQIGANIGILAGLILVGLQIKQNTDITRAELSHQLWGSVNQFQLAMMGENPAAVIAKAQSNPSELTDEEIRIVLSWTYFWHEFDTNAEYLRNAGLILIDDEHYTQLLKGRVNVYRHNPISRQTWELITKDGLTQDWMHIVDAEIRRLDQAGFQYDELFERFRKAAGQE